MTRPIVAVDTETTGLNPYTRQAWEFAAIRREPDGTKSRLGFFIHLDDLRDADPQALGMNHFYDRHPFGLAVMGVESDQAVIPLLQAAQLIVQITHGATIVGAQPHFDTVTMERLIRDQGLQPTWHYRLRDIEALAAGYLRRDDLGGLAGCAAALGLAFPEEKQHTAMGDAEMALAIYDEVFSPSGLER